MSRDAKLDRLRAMPMLASANKRSLQRLAAAIDTIDVPAGHVVVRQAHHNSEAFIVEAGWMDVRVDDESVAQIGEGEIVGEVSMLTGRVATATVVTRTPATLLVVPSQRFNQLMDDAPRIGVDIARTLAGRLADADARLVGPVVVASDAGRPDRRPVR